MKKAELIKKLEEAPEDHEIILNVMSGDPNEATGGTVLNVMSFDDFKETVIFGAKREE